jgi:hypothetical protein
MGQIGTEQSRDARAVPALPHQDAGLVGIAPLTVRPDRADLANTDGVNPECPPGPWNTTTVVCEMRPVRCQGQAQLGDWRPCLHQACSCNYPVADTPSAGTAKCPSPHYYARHAMRMKRPKGMCRQGGQAGDHIHKREQLGSLLVTCACWQKTQLWCTCEWHATCTALARPHKVQIWLSGRLSG